MIDHVLKNIEGIGPVDRLIVVVGHGRAEVIERVSSHTSDAIFVDQDEPLGTGDAVKRCEKALSGFDGRVVVLPGDSPLVRPASLRSLIDEHAASSADVAVLTAVLADATGYGRIIRRPEGSIEMVEQADATLEQREIREVSGGFWCFNKRFLFEALASIGNDNAQGEFYLPDAALAANRPGGILTVPMDDPNEILGINDRSQLAEAAAIMRARKIAELMSAGVTIEDPGTTYIDAGVEVGRDTTIRPLTFLEGTTTIGAGCSIGPSCRIVDSDIGDNVEVSFAVVKASRVGDSAEVGPFASLRPGTVLGPRSKVGTFVETKKTTIGEGSKVPHLSYIGDATIAEDVNVGAGTITCNYDGETKTKSETIIGKGALIGSDTMIVAPVTIGEGAVTGAGSVVVGDVAVGDVVVGAPARPVRKRKRNPT